MTFNDTWGEMVSNKLYIYKKYDKKILTTLAVKQNITSNHHKIFVADNWGSSAATWNIVEVNNGKREGEGRWATMVTLLFFILRKQL